MKRQADSEIDYYPDNALVKKDDDEFQHTHYVSVLKDILLKSQTPINVGLYGKWGVGKSSIVHMLHEEIEEDEELSRKFKYVEVDTWGISQKSLQQGILEEINEELDCKYPPEKLKDELYNVRQKEVNELKKMPKYVWATLAIIVTIISIWAIAIRAIFMDTLSVTEYILSILPVIELATIIAILGPFAKLFFSTSKKTIPAAVSSFQFNKIYKEMVNKQRKTLVVVIDNLDRCEDTVAVDLLGIIQTFMVKKNCINIIACDDEAIVTHLKNVKRNYTDRDGNEFLSKFFQVTIKIPPFIGENLGRYAEKLMENRSVKFHPFVKIILIAGAIENPRKINQFLNIAVALYRLADLKEKAGRLEKNTITGNTDFLMKIIVIRHEWPKFYKAVENNADLLTDEKKWRGWCATGIQQEIINQEEDDRLHRFLNATTASQVKDITPFLKLNRESYATESRIGEFEDAFITLNPKATHIFKELDDEKQEQYIHKISDVMAKHSENVDQLSLGNCAASLIDILHYISNERLRVIAFGILGRHMSSVLLKHLDRFDIEQLGLFQILEEMSEKKLDQFADPIYKRIVSNAFTEENSDTSAEISSIFTRGINENLVEEFFENGNIIKKEVMNQVDDKVANKISTDTDFNSEFVEKCIKISDWTENNIQKPSKIIKEVVEKINFQRTSEDAACTELYEKIKDSITDAENAIFYERMHQIINECDKSQRGLPPELLKHLTNFPIEFFDMDSDKKQKIFMLLCKSTEYCNRTQHEKIFEIVIPLYGKMMPLSDKTIHPDPYIEKAFADYVRRADADALRSILKQSGYSEFLKRKPVITSILKRYEELDSNIPEVIKFLLELKYSFAKLDISSEFAKMISSREESRFSTLFAVAKENDPKFDVSLMKSIRKACLDEAKDKTNPIRYSLYEHVIELQPALFDRTQISDYGIELIKDEKKQAQKQGFALLTKLNSSFVDESGPAGVMDAIAIASDLIQKNSELVFRYLDFIYQFKDSFSDAQTIRLISLLNRGLCSAASESVMNGIVRYVRQSSENILIHILDALIDFTAKTGYEHVKEQCKQIFIEKKDMIVESDIRRIRRIFGENIFE